MQGDKLAHGGPGSERAQFPQPQGVTHEQFAERVGADIPVEPERKVWCECKDCPKKFYSAKEFSDHLPSCNTASEPNAQGKRVLRCCSAGSLRPRAFR
jgi:hypothetical protein